MSMIMPIGARCFVIDLEPEIDLRKRAANAGLHVVIAEENVPKPTTGRVVAVGSDPLIQELVRVGDVVGFSRHAGIHRIIEGVEYRCLELREITDVTRESPATPLSRPDSPDPACRPEQPVDLPLTPPDPLSR